MTLTGAHRGFDLELDKMPGISSYPSFLPEEKDYWLNTSIERIIKTRYSGLNIHKTGFQQSQKRSDDLRTVVKEASLALAVTEDVEFNLYQTDYPTGYWIGLGETAHISFTEGDTDYIKRTEITEATIENIDSKLLNTLSPHRLHNQMARPLRLYSNGKINLYSDKNYEITSYNITYIAKPALLDWYVGSRTVELTVMPDHMWDEIIVGAVRLALENISEPRYQTYSSESQVIE